MSVHTQKHLSLKNRNLVESSKEIIDIPFSYPDIIDLNLSNNQLIEYPKCLLQCKSLIALDIRKNNFNNFEELVDILSQYPYLAELNIDFTDSTQVQFLLSKVRKLIVINGKGTKDFVSFVDIEDSEIDNISLKNSLPYLNQIFVKFQNNLQRNNEKEKAKELFNEFQSLINEEAGSVSSCDENLPNYVMADLVVKSEFHILKYFSTKLLELDPGFDYSERISITKVVFDGLFKLIDQLSAILRKITPKIAETEEIMRTQLEIVLQNMQQNIGGLSTNNDEMDLFSDKNSNIYQKDKDFYMTKIERLENENKYMTDKLLQLGKQIADFGTFESKAKKTLTTASDQSQFGFTTNGISFINHPSSVNQSLSIGVTGAKILSINSMREIIAEIYESKIEHDKRCIESNLPRETMEQHMYSHLNKKYGLRNLVIEWASSIINCIKLYSNEDCDICLFGKIIRNEIEEDSRLIMNKLKSTINELVEYSIKAKTPFMAIADLKKSLQTKMEGILTQEEWKNILYSIHSNEDANLIENQILQIIHKENSKKPKLDPKNQEKRITREQIISLSKQPENQAISYKNFIQCVCNHHIQYRDKYLKNLVKYFRKCDEDSDGIVNEDEFKNLIQIISLNMDNIDNYTQKLLGIIDPYNHQKITFSECVTLFSIELIEDNNTKEATSLLDHICLTPQ